MEAHEAILNCTRLMAHEKLDYRDVTLEGISRGAGVAKTTIYRWWSQKVELMREACLLGRIPRPNTGSLKSDLEELVRLEIEVQTSAASRPVFAGLLADLIARSETPGFNEPCPYQAERCAILTDIFDNATARGEWSGELDLETTYETLFSMIFYRYIGLKKTFDDKQIAHFANRILQEADLAK